MTAYYNEHDPFAAAWLRELIKSGAIAYGEIDERPIEDVLPGELMGFTQCHFFAGIGGWSHALRLAGWDDSRPVWTGSCPCQPFSSAGKGKGTSDERHLWPAFEWLIRQCRPNIVFGEQVEAAIKHDWLDVVATSLESIGYAVGAVGFPASSVGAYHLRKRLYWVACAECKARQQHGRELGSTAGGGESKGAERERFRNKYWNDCQTCGVADSERNQREPWRPAIGPGSGDEAQGPGSHAEPGRCGNAGELGDSEPTGLQEQQWIGAVSPGEDGTLQGKAIERTGAPTLWSDAEWIYCRDGKHRPIQRATQSESIKMADGLRNDLGLVRLARQAEGEKQGEEVTVYAPLVARGRNRAGRLRGYGNAICVPAASEFIRAFMEQVGQGQQ